MTTQVRWSFESRLSWQLWLPILSVNIQKLSIYVYIAAAMVFSPLSHHCFKIIFEPCHNHDGIEIKYHAFFCPSISMWNCLVQVTYLFFRLILCNQAKSLTRWFRKISIIQLYICLYVCAISNWIRLKIISVFVPSIMKCDCLWQIDVYQQSMDIQYLRLFHQLFVNHLIRHVLFR
jgi:hypothetical protein